ncbi:hypothetical protein FS837_013046 [Tulasnella sp. UAMH 9824]|nr:hypothetical protein FS837_013046 [Tulasnella sp. UAMH 9824]
MGATERSPLLTTLLNTWLTGARYKDDACNNVASPLQTAFTILQIHASVQNFWNLYTNLSQLVNATGKELIMLETNTSSCRHFVGASDSSAAGLYLIELALQGRSISMSQNPSPERRYLPNVQLLHSFVQATPGTFTTTVTAPQSALGFLNNQDSIGPGPESTQT